ncbi:MAG: Flp pilus assembly complex ATPase component TadA [Elusimicrobiota bacterium]|jgi:type II secretory ATPase GspE/PulE/Tfp pilus assembly ATPase PilB-like protein|nr:Flp pilus assembly complex ATPase component TadA [Elusimicrobiota bacterium]
MAKKLTEILMEQGKLNEEALSKATLHSQQSGISLQDSLMALGLVREEDITIAISKQLSVPYASRENNILIPEKDQNLSDYINERYARENLVLPLFEEDGSLAVAMNDPSNVFLIDNLKMMTGLEIQPFIASKSQIFSALDNFYANKDMLKEVIAEDPEDNQIVEGVQESLAELASPEGKLDLDKETSGGAGTHYIKMVNVILRQAMSERASDIHLELFDERVSLRFRIDGSLYERTSPPKEAVSAIISRIKILSKLDIAEKRLPQDGSFAVKFHNRTIELRVSVCPTVFGEKLVLRILDKGTGEVNVDKLGFEPRQKKDFLEAAALPHGLIFLTGPTGSGKTTTLNAVLTTIKTPELNYMTLEDPVEYKLAGISQVQVKPQIGLTFAAGLRSFLRQDPDVILVGEVRDSETAEACLKAALTGHLVLSTLHTNEAIGAVPRLIDMGIEPFLLASSLALVAAQRLVRVLCPYCKVPYIPTPETIEQALRESQLPEREKATWTFFRASGCPKCSGTGYQGRKAIYEVFRVNEAMRNTIYKTRDLIELRKASISTGAWNLRASGWRKAVRGITSVEEVLSVTTADE